MKDKSIEELERESAEIRLEIDKAMQKAMKNSERADMFFKVMQVLLIVMLLVSIITIVAQTIIDSKLLETYDNCIDVNNERYCKVDE